jgi:hypothetical protein
MKYGQALRRGNMWGLRLKSLQQGNVDKGGIVTKKSLQQKLVNHTKRVDVRMCKSVC